MKKTLVALGLLAALGSAQAVELYSNGPVASAGSPPLSVIRLGGSLLGAGQQANLPNLVGDNFTVTGPGWNVESLNFFGYQTGAASTFSFTSATWSIISGDVNTGTVVASGTGTPVTDGGLVGYRVSSTTLTDRNRAIFNVGVDIPDITLAPGDYWLTWGLTGTLASGPWQPPTSDGVVGNAVQSLALSPFVPIVDGLDNQGVELPFIIQGSLVPEPGTYALMLLGGLAVVGAARRRRARA